MKVKVAELIANYSPVYPRDNQTWQGVIDYYRSDPYEQFKVDTLIEALQRGESFREPIALYSDSKTVGNGTHRLVASYLVGADDIDVIYWNEDDDEDEESIEEDDSNDEDEEREVFVETDLTVSIGDLPEEESFDMIIGVLFSVPLSDQLWVTSSACGGGSLSEDRTMSFSVPWDDSRAFTSEEIKALESKIVFHLESFGFKILAISSQHITD